MATRYTSNGPGRLDLEDGSRRLPPGGQPGADRVDGRELRRLIADLSRDASQLAHDELTLAKLEIRDVAEAFSSDIKAASRMRFRVRILT
jgi:hypothetical protein